MGQTDFDWPGAIGKNRAALLRIVAGLFALVGLAESEAPATVPRHLRNHLLRILRPAESAARRLIVIVARGLVVSVRPRAEARGRAGRKHSIANIVYPPGYRPEGLRRSAQNPKLEEIPFPLIDPLKRFDVGPARRRAKTFPRITCIGLSEPTPVPADWIPSPDDPVDAAGLRRRLASLRRALDDLPGQAERLARWKARRDFRLKQGDRRPMRLSPIRPGGPPGRRKRPFHEVDDVLRECHSLALYARRLDSS